MKLVMRIAILTKLSFARSLIEIAGKMASLGVLAENPLYIHN